MGQNQKQAAEGLFATGQQFNDARQLYLARDIESTGIQEKYLKSQLSSNEPLTELDIKRFILSTGMVGKIQVVDLNPKEIGLALSNQSKPEAKDPYSVVMMVNAGSKTEGANPQWLSVIVTINPLSNDISYKINSEDSVSQEQENVIKNAINGVGNDYAAFPEAAKVSGTMKQIKPDSGKPSGGYKVLHQLYRDGLPEEIQARKFADVEPNSKAIRNAVYEVELRAIKLDKDHEQVLNNQIVSNFQNGIIKDEAVDRQISLLGSSVPAVTNQHPLVTEKIADLQLYHNKINFPGDKPSIPLSSVDYQQFLLLVNEKFRASGTHKVLNEMVMPCDSTALEGLIAYNETKLPLPFKSLTLDLKGLNLSVHAVRESVLFNLKSALLSMSENHLSELKFDDSDAQLNEEIVNEVAGFVKSRHIAVDITLPDKFQATQAQREIDEAVSDNIRERNIQELGKEIAKVEASQPIAKEVRSRPKLSGKQNLSIDIELQQEQQVEVAVEAGVEKSSGVGGVEDGEAEVYDLAKFQDALHNGRFAESSKSYLVNESKADESAKLWRTWLGFLTNTEANQQSNLRLSKTACEELLRYKDKFQYGLDLRDLPPGFVLRTEGKTSFIHFDENLKLLAAYNPLQVQTIRMPAPVPLTNSQFNAWIESAADNPIKAIWDKINEGAYDKNTHRIFKQYLPQMLLLDKPQLELLSSLCLEQDGNFNKKKFEFLLANASELKPILAGSISNSNIETSIKSLFADQSKDAEKFIKNYRESHPKFKDHLLNQVLTNDNVDKAKITNLIEKVPGLNLNGVLQVYIQLGEKGIDSLARRVDDDVALFNQLNIAVFAQSNSYMSVLNEDYQDAINAIKGFSDNERIWWNSLLKQHCDAQRDVNLVDLVNAFKQFKGELGKLSAKDGQPLLFPKECLLKGVTSLPIALSRMLTLLKHTNQENRLEQWKELSSLDFSSTGVPKLTAATEGKRWAFITPEMNINVQHELANPNQQNATQYQAPWKWKSITESEPDKVVENYFRFAAYQAKDGQLPLEFYRYAHESIVKSGLSPEAQKYMYGLIASATTDARNVNAVKSLDEAKKDCDHLIKLIKNPPMASILTKSLEEQARLQLLSNLYGLENQPPLPMLNRLVSLISSSLSNPLKAMKNMQRLNDANDSLQEFVGKYQSCIYEGMKDYLDEDYKGGELFFTHMDVLKSIEARFDEYDYNSKTNLIKLISTFRIKEADLDRIITAHFGDDVKGVEKARRDEALFLILPHVSSGGKTKLNADDLIHILNEVRKPNEKEVIDVIKGIKLPHGGQLSDFIPESILAGYGKKGVPEAVTKLIADNFNEQQRSQIEQMLLRFNGPTDSAHYNEIVNKLILITKPPLPQLEKNIFIAKLCSSMGLYSDIKALDAENNQFVKLLDAIIAKNSPDDFINFIAAERNLLHASSKEQIDEFFVKKPTELAVANLDQKGLLYMNNVLPGIRELGDLNISQVDLTPRILETILKTPTEQLGAPSSAEIKEEVEFNLLKQALEGVLAKLNDKDKIDFKELKTSTDSFLEKSGLKESESFKKYSDYIEKISQSKISQEDAAGLAQNPALLLMVLYLTNPEAMPQEQRLLFEERYKDKIEALVKEYPGIMLNKDSLNSLLNNPEFFNALAEKDVIAATKNPDLLEEDVKKGSSLDLVFAALDKDLKGVTDFKQKTKNLQSELSKQKDALHTYPNVFNNLYKKINKVVGDNLNSKKQFLELFDTYLEHYSPKKHGELLNYLTQFVTTLENSFEKTADKNIVLSLCLQFNNEKDEELTPEKLLELLHVVGEVPQKNQSTVLKIAVALINNEKDYKLEDIKKLCDVVKKDSIFAEEPDKIYKKAPFPTITQVIGWNEEAKKSTSAYSNIMERFYEDYSKRPCHREIVDHTEKALNGFHVDKALSQFAKFKFNGKEPSPEELEKSKIDFENFRKVTVEMQGKTRDELVELFNSFKGKKPGEVDNDLLVAVAAELLHRSKGKDDKDSKGNLKLGSSFEINTTQYMAILTMMKDPGHVTSQIGTGEGKSRIMMISLACQNALGKTVDFVTSDAQLATRDFVEFQAYFEMIGAKTSMIFANSDPSEYKKGGINFSDPSNLSLFRNKARSMARGEEVLDDDAANRALLLDEADKTYFDVADTRFNFSKEGDENIRGMEWVYPSLMEYFAQKEVTLSDGTTKISPLELYYKDVDQSREKFLQFASGSCTSAQLMRLKALSNAQIEQWQVSAVTTSQLKFKDDFVIEPDVLISTSSGPKISSEAQLLFANRVSKSSKFSFGVHQCLHARLNIARQNLNGVEDVNLREALQKCEQSFYVPDEKQIVYSSTSKNLLDDYREGTLKAVTGTAGSILEREEARQLYGDSAQREMQFVDVPRDKGLNRRDKAIRLTTNPKQQIESLVEQIKEARAKNQPILIIAENDEESTSLFKKLNEVFKEDIQHIHSQLSLEDEKARVGIAGRPGQITVSTDMIGRGTDISLKGAATMNGLNVMLTYLPRVRDLEQIVGRSGRFGAQGETSLVLDKQRLKKALGKSALGSDYYRNVEAYVEREQAIMDRNKQCERLIKNTVGDFRKEITNNFFNDMLKQVDKSEYKKLMPAWTSFFDKSDKAWNETWPHIQKELSKDKVNINAVEKLLTEYKENAQKMWNVLRRNVQDVDVVCHDGKKTIEKLNADLPTLKVTDSTKKLITGFDINQYSLDKVKVYDKYDPGHDGRAVKYKHWSIPVIASLKGWANLLPGVHFADARKPFANFRAWIDGRGQIFPNTRAWIANAVDFIKNLFNPKKTIVQQTVGQKDSLKNDAQPKEKDPKAGSEEKKVNVAPKIDSVLDSNRSASVVNFRKQSIIPVKEPTNNASLEDIKAKQGALMNAIKDLREECEKKKQQNIQEKNPIKTNIHLDI